MSFIAAAMNRGRNSLGSSLAMVCCAVAVVVLLAASAVAQAAHLHLSKNNLSRDECSLCIVAHAPALVGATVHGQRLLTVSRSAVVWRAPRRVVTLVCSLFIRPPPSI